MGVSPVAKIRSPSPTDTAYPQQTLKGTVTVVGDIVGPAVPEEHWDSLGRPEKPRRPRGTEY